MANARTRKSKNAKLKVARRRASTRAAAPRPARARSRRAELAGRDAIAVLTSDHVRIKSLLAALQKARTAASRESLIEQAAEALKQHTAIEEQVFYPAFREAAKTDKDRRLFHEATEEHHVVDVVLPEVRAARHEPDVFAARAKVLRELVEHHIEEEQNDLFPRARRLMSELELHELATQLNACKRDNRPGGGALHAVGALIGLTS